ncbi:unnamed protein product [Closterium sp. NIES-54]
MFITLYFMVTRLPDSLRFVTDHFLSLDPTSLTVDLLEQHLLAAETSAVAVGAARGTPRPPFFEGCSPSPLAPSYASAAAADVSVPEDVGAASASAKRCSSNDKGGRGGGGGSDGGGGASESGGGGSSGGGGGGGTIGGSGGSGGDGGGSGGSGGSGGGGTGSSGTDAPRVGSGGGERQQQQRRSETPSPQQLREWFLRGASGGSCPAQGDCYRCVPPDPAIAAAALGAIESRTLFGTAPTEALHTFPLDSGASRCFFRDSTTLTPLPAPVPVRLADPSGGPVVAHSTTVLPCPAVPSGSLSGLHLPSFSTNLVSTAALQDAMVTTTTPGGQRVSICTCTWTGRQVAASCSCRPLSHQTLLWHHRLGHPSLPRLRGMHSRLLVSSLPRSLPPLLPLPAPPFLPCVEGRQRAAPHSSSLFSTIAPLQTLKTDSVSSSASGSTRTFLSCVCTLTEVVSSPPPSCLVMEFARTSMIHAAAPHFLWSFVVWYTAHQLNLWLRVSLPETSPTLRWTGEVGDAFVWGDRAFVRDTSADKLSPSAIPCDVPFDESVPFYRLFPNLSAPPLPPPLFLAPGPPPVDPLLPQGPAPSGVSQVDPLPGPAPLQVVVDSGAARGAAYGGAEPGGAESEGAETGGAEPGGAETGGAEPGGVVFGGGEPGGAKPEGVEPRGAASVGAESEGAEPQGAASSRGSAGASPSLSLQKLREWFVRRTRLRRGASGAGGAGAAGGGVTRVAAGAGVTGDLTESGTTGAGGAGAGGAGVGGPGARGAGAGGPGVGGANSGGARAVASRGAVRPRPYFVPLLKQVLSTPPFADLPPLLLCPPPDRSLPPLQPTSPLPAPFPYTEQSGGHTERREPGSHPVSPVRTTRRVPRSRPPPVPITHAMTLRPSSVPLRSAAASALVAELLDFSAACRLDYASALVAESASDCPPSVGAKCALGTDVLEDRQEDFESLAATVPRFASMLLAPEGDPDAPDIPTLRSYAEAITGPYSSQWQAAMDAKMASWKSSGTYVDKVSPPGANIVDGMWIFKVKRPPGSSPAFKARYVARGFTSAPPPFFSSTPAAGAAEGGGDLQPCAALQPCAPYAPCCPAALQPCAPYGRAAAATALAAVLRALQPCCALRALLPCCPVRALLPSACAMHSPVHEPAAPVACGSVAPAAQS